MGGYSGTAKGPACQEHSIVRDLGRSALEWAGAGGACPASLQWRMLGEMPGNRLETWASPGHGGAPGLGELASVNWMYPPQGLRGPGQPLPSSPSERSLGPSALRGSAFLSLDLTDALGCGCLVTSLGPPQEYDARCPWAPSLQ